MVHFGRCQVKLLDLEQYHLCLTSLYGSNKNVTLRIFISRSIRDKQPQLLHSDIHYPVEVEFIFPMGFSQPMTKHDTNVVLLEDAGHPWQVSGLQTPNWSWQNFLRTLLHPKTFQITFIFSSLPPPLSLLLPTTHYFIMVWCLSQPLHSFFLFSLTWILSKKFISCLILSCLLLHIRFRIKYNLSLSPSFPISQFSIKLYVTNMTYFPPCSDFCENIFQWCQSTWLNFCFVFTSINSLII